MCIFSGGQGQAVAVQFVGNTNIFARLTGSGSQILVYSMTVGATADVAMILPVPVPPNSPEDAVRFINLERYPHLFDDLRNLFPGLVSGGIPIAAAPRGAAAPPLVVHDVGAFEASFVPTLADFARLDARFTLPPQTWAQLPAYADWGFAVFKLKGLEARAKKQFHPMAFEFPTRKPDALFFPTVHVHDGQVHETAHFNHELYCQIPAAAAGKGWFPATMPLVPFVDVARAENTLDPNQALYRRMMSGPAPNQDQWIQQQPNAR